MIHAVQGGFIWRGRPTKWLHNISRWQKSHDKVGRIKEMAWVILGSLAARFGPSLSSSIFTHQLGRGHNRWSCWPTATLGSCTSAFRFPMERFKPRQGVWPGRSGLLCAVELCSPPDSLLRYCAGVATTSLNLRSTGVQPLAWRFPNLR